MKFGGGKKNRWLSIHAYSQHLGKQRCLVLLFWYVFTGCDTISSFNGSGEKNVWNMWEITHVK